jgi:hypothetical protein
LCKLNQDDQATKSKELDKVIVELGGLLKSILSSTKACLAKSEEEYQGRGNLAPKI